MGRFGDQLAETDVIPAFVYLARSGQMRIVRSQVKFWRLTRNLHMFVWP